VALVCGPGTAESGTGALVPYGKVYRIAAMHAPGTPWGQV
jgi:hypothetical protein